MDDEVTPGRRSVPISALEHYAYCPRQAALIYVEAYFDSNVDTTRGDLAHAAVDRLGVGQDRRRQRVWRSLPVWSDVFGLHGVCASWSSVWTGRCRSNTSRAPTVVAGRLTCRSQPRCCA